MKFSVGRASQRLRLVPQGWRMLCPALLVSLAGSASADEPNAIELHWEAEADCAEQAPVDREIARILGRLRGPRRAVVARAEVTRQREVWHVELTSSSDGQSRQRGFEAESCAAARSAVAVILALAVDPNASPVAATQPPAAVGPLPQPPTAASEPPTAASEPPTAASEPPTAASPPATPLERGPPTSVPLSGGRASHVFVAASVAVDQGSLPRASLGGELVLGLALRPLRIELSGSAWGANDALEPLHGSGARFRLLSGEVRAGYSWQIRQFSVGPTAGVAIARLSAGGFGGSLANHDAVKWLVGPALGGAVEWRPAHWLALRLAAESVFWLVRPGFVVEQAAPEPPSLVHRPAALTGRGLLGGEFRFW